VRVPPGKSVKVEAFADGFFPGLELLRDDSGPDELILLGRRPSWKASLGEPLKFPPILTGDLVLTVLQSGTLSVFSRITGSELWTQRGRGVVSPVSNPVLAAGRIFLPFNDGEIRRFSLDGALELRLKPSGLISTPLQAWGDSLIFGTSNGSVMRWDLKENRAIWSFTLRSPPFRLTSYGANRLLAATEKGSILLVEHPSGATVWEAPLREKIVFGPVVMGELIVVRCSDNQVVVLDGRTGKVLSRRTLSAPYQALPLVDRQRILILENTAAGKSEVVEIDPAASVPLRRVALPQPVTSLFDVAGSVGAALPSGGLLCMDSSTYQPLWSYQPASGNVVSCAADGRGVAIATDTGEVTWLPGD